MKLELEIVGLIDGILFALAIIAYAVLEPSFPNTRIHR